MGLGLPNLFGEETQKKKSQPLDQDPALLKFTLA